ncbi:vitamin B12 dependent-methionine synthase activation domain-containing protein [Dysgonomonas sp. UBA7698]|uniref:vitamin B12 dependent-methionine synthase activation domain-containing protein n=1 Tax=Dysgonomonas sp. UBA7698 TaxID=1946427 RepID=UPI0025BBA198|nr:vitamin B12 dependent-methionine synthase activation domain-containing protein [Dysgonomonas sp. UBA7698]
MDDIYLSLGYGGTCPPDDIQSIVKAMTETISHVCQPSFCYIIKDTVIIERSGIIIDDVNFKTGKVIASYLDKAEAIAFFIATAGLEFDNWLKDLHRQNDVWNMFLADAIGSEIAEATARAVSKELEKFAKSRNQNISNSYSPGYCGWIVKEQQKLFSLFPTEPCGVKLTDSSLMLPIKSVSGIIALGTQQEKKIYGCDICNMKSCYKKRSSSG